MRLRLQDEHEVSAAARITAPSRWTIVSSRTPPRRRRDGLIHRSRSTQAPDHRGDAPPLPRRRPVDAHVPRRRQGEPLDAHGRQPRRVHREELRFSRCSRRGLQQPSAPRAPAAPQGVLGTTRRARHRRVGVDGVLGAGASPTAARRWRLWRRRSGAGTSSPSTIPLPPSETFISAFSEILNLGKTRLVALTILAHSEAELRAVHKV